MESKATIVQVDPHGLKPAEYNPRKISPEKRSQLRKSLIKFGFTEPIVVNTSEGREQVIVGGFQRVQLAIEMGFKTVPAVLVKLTLEEEKELNVRLNDGGEFDFSMLQTNFDGDLLQDLGFGSLVIDEEFTAFDANMGRKRSHVTITGNHDIITGDIDVSSKEADYVRTQKGIILSLGTFRIKVHVQDYFDWESKIKREIGVNPSKHANHLAKLLGITQWTDSQYVGTDKVEAKEDAKEEGKGTETEVEKAPAE